jgi:hypothetical protein
VDRPLTRPAPSPLAGRRVPAGRIGAMTGQVFLELLARDAAAVEFEGPLLDARLRGEDPDTVAELERSKLLALRVRGVLEHRRRREAELTALFETAGDLAALRDLDAVLQAIVHRARQLLGTDVAYLSLNDDDRGDTYMRVTDGSVSARFQRVRLRMGAGLGGLVAQSATPYATASYFDDDRFRHTRDIDGAVAEEGLVGILGVPLLLGSRVIGVLYAADRSERPFAREEVALLCSLAAHAAVAIDNARLLEETRAALDELNTASQLIQRHSQSVERAAEAHDRLADLVLRGGGVEDVACAVTEVLGGALLVIDAAHRPLATVGEVVEPTPEELRSALASSRSTGRAVRMDHHWVACVVAGTEHLGALVLRRGVPLDDADQRILERAALVTALLLLFQRSVTEAESRVRGELLGDLITAVQRDPEGLRQRARHLGADLDRPTAVVVARAEDVRPDRLSFAAGHLASVRGGLAGEYAGAAVLLLPGTDPGEAARRVAVELAAAVGEPVTAGGAGPVAGPEQVAGAYAAASRCLRTLIALDRTGDGASTEDLGFVGLILGDGGDVGGFVAATIGPVIDYDERRGTDLLSTLEAYFNAAGNLTRTRDALQVHVNTVTQRLDRIGQLIGAGWQQADRALEVQLALRLHRLRHVVDGA